jgi:hypothetical protein
MRCDAMRQNMGEALFYMYVKCPTFGNWTCELEADQHEILYGVACRAKEVQGMDGVENEYDWLVCRLPEDASLETETTRVVARAIPIRAI